MIPGREADAEKRQRDALKRIFPPARYLQEAGMCLTGFPTQVQTSLLSVVTLGVIVTTELDVAAVP